MGHTGKKDSQLAIEYYKQAAEQGLVFAMNSLGQIFMLGDGVEWDYESAMYWFQQAESAGNTEALINISRLYFNGWGVEKNHRTAVQYLWVASDAGNPAAKKMLESLGVSDRGVQAATPDVDGGEKVQRRAGSGGR